MGAPAVGTVVDGYRFKGGDYKDRTSWEQVEAIDVSNEYGPGARRYPNGTLVRIGPRGGVEPIRASGADATGDGASPELREFEINAAARATLMDAGQEDYARAIRDGYQPGSWWNSTARGVEGIPVVGNALANLMRSDVADRGRAAELQFVDGALRTTSGANAPEPEVIRANRAYFPSYGESAGVTSNKEELRDRFRNQSVRAAGAAYLSPEDLVGSNAASGLPSYPTLSPLAQPQLDQSQPGLPAPQAGEVRVTQQPLAADDTPESLRAQGYVYDAARDTWTRSRQEVAPTPQSAVADRNDDNTWWRRLDGFVRGAADTATFGLADEIAAGGDALIGRGDGDSFGERYQNNLAIQRALDQSDSQSIPATRFTGQVAGGVAAPGAVSGGRFIASAPNLAGALGRSALVGGTASSAYAYGNADEDRLEAAQQAFLPGALTGAALAGAGRAVGGAIRGRGGRGGNPPSSGGLRDDIQTLDQNGVFVTPGARRGGLAKSVEDLSQRAPILGSSVRGARQRSVESVNRAVANRALSSIGEGLPAEVSVGAEATDYVARRLGQQFDRAADMVQEVALDEPALTALASIAARKTDLPESAANQFDRILQDRLSRLNGPVSGRQLRQVESEIGELATRVDDRQLSDMLSGVRDVLQDTMARANPEAGQILNSARAGYRDYAIMRRASQAAGGNAFTPSQLLTAIRGNDTSVGNGMTARGQAPLQDLARAARNVIPDGYGNPGTADAVGYGGLGMLGLTNPPAALATVTGLSAAATPYMLMGRKIVEGLPQNPSPERARKVFDQLEKLAAKDPNVKALQQQLLPYLANAARVAIPGAVGAQVGASQ
jgi:hypothetical protein